MPPSLLPLEVSLVCLAGRRPRARPEIEGTVFLFWPEKILDSVTEEGYVMFSHLKLVACIGKGWRINHFNGKFIPSDLLYYKFNKLGTFDFS